MGWEEVPEARGRSRYSTLPLLEVPSLNMTSGLSFDSVQTAGAHWLEDALHRFGILHAVYGTDRLKPMLRAVSSRAQEVCKSPGGRPGLPSPINLRFLWT